MSQLQSLKKSHHFFQLQRLVRSKCISLIFKPWQPCCFGTEIQYIHSPSMTAFATTLSFKSENDTPNGRSTEYRLWYHEICSAKLLLGQSHILHNEWLGKWRLAQAQCLMHTTCRTQERISRLVCCFYGGQKD